MSGVPDVSFIVAAYNVEAFLETSVRSALDQVGVTVEVIIVDDGSTDATFSIASALAHVDPRIRLIKGAGQGGPARARNLGIAHARGIWIAILDSDDWILSDRTARLLEIAEASGADIVADNVLLVHETAGSQMSKALLERGQSRYLSIVSPAAYLNANVMFGGGPNLGYLKPMFRSAFLKRHDLIYDEDVRIGEDFHLCLDCLLAKAHFVVTSEPLYMYRIRANSLSWRLRTNDLDVLQRKHKSMSGLLNRQQDLSKASKRYGDGLARARAVTVVIEFAKRGDWRGAFLHAAESRNAWRLLLRMVGEKAVALLAKVVRAPPRKAAS